MRLLVEPLVSIRDFHETMGETTLGRWGVTPSASALKIEAEGHTLLLASDGAPFEHTPRLVESETYDLELERGYPGDETLLSPGRFALELQPGAPVSFTITAALAPDAPPTRAEQPEPTTPSAPSHDLRAALERAAEHFLVDRVVDGTRSKTVIAGYPWFADWGRDTMIALPGLMLTTKKFDDARACLETFARHVDRGMIPNRFDDYTGEPHYNTIDASLWFLHAVREYARLSGDAAAVRGTLLDACLAIIDGYAAGTRYGIRLDPADALIAGGDETTQLTWMDAKRDGVVFTPRHGKAVEINALWHHGMLCVAELLDTLTLDAERAVSLRDSRGRRPTHSAAPSGTPSEPASSTASRPTPKALGVRSISSVRTRSSPSRSNTRRSTGINRKPSSAAFANTCSPRWACARSPPASPATARASRATW